MSCVLRVSGIDFDVDAFLKVEITAPTAILRKGEPRNPKTKPFGEKLGYSSLNFEVSSADFSEFKKQTDDAIAYLRTNEPFMRRLVNFEGVEFVSIDFGVEIALPEWHSFCFPSELALLAGKLQVDLRLSIYPILND